MRKGSRKGSIIVVGIILIIIAVYGLLNPQNTQIADEPTGTGSGTNAQAYTDTQAHDDTQEHSDANANDNTGVNEEAGESPIRVTELEGLVPGGYIKAVVKRVVDGDTVRAEYEGEEYRVRLLCVDTPESVKENVKEQPFGKQASERLEQLVLGKEVRLLFEKDLWDNYDRLLAYVILEDGACANVILITEGLARVNSVKPNTVHRDYFNTLQTRAIEEGRGLWSLPEEERPFVKKDDNYYVPRYYEDEAA